MRDGAAAYFIASEFGSDSLGDGSQARPWKTYANAKANSADGDVIVGNGLFRELVDQTNGARRVLRAWGRGCTYSGADDISGKGTRYKWTPLGGNTYALVAIGGGDPGITVPPFLLLDGVRIARGTVGNLADHEWGALITNYTTIALRDDSGRPNDTGVLIELPVRDYCIHATGAFDFDLDGVNWYGAKQHGAKLYDCSGDHRVGNFRAHSVRFHGIQFGTTSSPYTVRLFGDIEAYDCGNNGVVIGGGQHVHAVLAGTVHTHHCSWTESGDSSSAGFRMVAWRDGYFTMERGALIWSHHNVGSGPGGRGVWFDGVVGAGPSFADRILSHDNLVNLQIEACHDFTAQNVISFNALSDGIQILASVWEGEVWTSERVKVLNSLAYGSGQGGLVCYGAYQWTASDSITDCGFINCIGIGNLYDILALNGGDNVSDGNGRGRGNFFRYSCLGPEHNAMVRWAYQNYASYAAFEAIHPPAAGTNVKADPQLMDPVHGNFRPRTSSPLRDAGLAVAGVTHDFDGVRRHDPPTIGAYEVP